MTLEKQLAEKLLYSIHIKDHKNVEEYSQKYWNHLAKITKNKTDMELFDRVGNKLRGYYKELMNEEDKR